MEYQKTNNKIYHAPEEKRIWKVKAKGCAEGRYHQDSNQELESSSHLVPSSAYMGSCVMDTMDYNYKLRSGIG